MAAERSTSSSAGHWSALIEGCLLIGLATMLLRKVWDGVLPMYIHPRYTPLVVFAVVVLAALGLVRLWWDGSDNEAAPQRRIGMYGLLLVPLLLGMLIPARPAGSALVDPQQLNVTRRGYSAPRQLAATPTSAWTLLDWAFARALLAPEEVDGKEVDVVGFVYQDPNGTADQFYVVRYVMSCCVADRAGVSLPVRWADAAGLPNDRWVRVTGTMEARRAADGAMELVVRADAVETVPQPREPYLYP